ncbi:hypothetical protein Cantr_01243 [Candida viswanathii]|uniref:Uncharacterized protein n=1 Tax=Candida viswanathii TaxID=5486 RepID=A0A367YK08_9ASCO|nr:hypothetical protein Cantr_01243 [Candida viswanathii]
MDNDIQDYTTPELPQVAIFRITTIPGVGSLCREPLPCHKLTMPSERPVDLRGLSAPEELSLPLAKDRNVRDTAFSELPRATVLSAPEQPAPPFRAHHDASDGASSELPRVPVDDVDGNEKITDPFRSRTRTVSIKRPRRANFTAVDGSPPSRHRVFRITTFPGVGSLCRELLPGHKLTMPSERPVDLAWIKRPRRAKFTAGEGSLSAPEQPAPPFRVHHDPSDGDSSELPEFRDSFLCRIFRITTFPGVGSLCREPLPCHKLTMPSERPVDLRGLSAPEELSLPLAKDRNVRDTAFSELPRATVLSAPEQPAPPFRVHHDPSDGDSSELPRVPVDDVDGNEKITDPFRSRTRTVSIKRPRRANFTAVDGSPPSRRQIFRITTFPGVGSLCRELLPCHKLTMPSERPVDLRGLSAPEELSYRWRRIVISVPGVYWHLQNYHIPGVGSLCREPLPCHKLTMPSERPVDLRGLSAPEELSLPLAKDHNYETPHLQNYLELQLSVPEQPAPPFRVHHDPSDGDSSELPRVPVDDVDGNEKITDPFRSRTRTVSIKRPRRANFTAVDGSPPSRRQIFRITTFPGVGSLCREPLPCHKLTMPSERPVDLRGLSAPEELSLPLAKDRNARDTASSELPRATVSMTSTEMKKSPTHRREEEGSIKRPRRANFTAVDGSPPSRRQIFRITTIPGVGSLCREPLPCHKLTMPSERPVDLRGLSAPEELSLPLAKDHNLRDTASSELPRATVLSVPEQPAPPFRVHHDPSDGDSSELPRVPVDDVDGNEKIIDPFRSRTRTVSIKRPRRANFTAVDGSPPSRRQIFRITTFPGVGSLCRELLPCHKLTMPSERPVDLRGLSAPEELSLPLAKDRDL